MNTKIIASVILIAILFFALGASTNFEIVKKFVLDTPEKNVEPLNFMNKFEINELIDIKTQNELLDERSFLINFIWKDEKLPEDYNIEISPMLEIVKVSEPAQREAGIKVETVEELVDKLKNEAGVI